jgi:3-oxoadipate enol-lactonase
VAQIACHELSAGENGWNAEDDHQMPSLTTGAVTIAYDVEGDGPWLTLVHGFSQDRCLWSAQRSVLAGSYRLLSVDLRGHGGSGAPESGYGPVEYAGDLLTLLDALGIAATHFWGTHTGASVGLYLATLHPERIASLALEGAVIPGVPVGAVEEQMARARRIAVDQGLDAARVAWFDESPFFESIRSDPLRCRAAEHRAMVLDFSGAPWLATAPPQPVPDIGGRLTTLRQPVLLMNGSDDLPEFHDTAARLARELRDCRRYVIPGTGPFPLWEHPEAVTPVVARFLEDVD